MDQWQIVFYSTSGMYIVGMVAYLLLADGEEQEWNKPEFLRKHYKMEDNVHIPEYSPIVNVNNYSKEIKI